MREKRNKFRKEKEVESLDRQSRYVDDEGRTLVFEEGYSTNYPAGFELMSKFYIVDDDSNLIQALIPVSNLERDSRIALLYELPPSVDANTIHGVYSEAGKVMSIKLSQDEFARTSSAEIEFSCCMSVAVALAIAVRSKLPAGNVVPKTKSINVDSFHIQPSAPVKCLEIFRRKIFVGFNHIPMTEDWLEKIFGVFGAVQGVTIFRPGARRSRGDEFVPSLGFAVLQFRNSESVKKAIHLNKQLIFVKSNVQVVMEVTACDGTRLDSCGNVVSMYRRRGS
ncbi:hypothetical protein POM88_051764 [Heracleum sosnowskyi]|uniref:RRM domain-containing protein n=1 Tax=Heracleum sosnowskyi TaxID=360622 RepID=A0AAD8H1E3_9APIA|nr:hypothetical protein POM88_051764 [Heracleum sosnowskyi]